MNRPTNSAMNSDMNPFSEMLGWLGGRSFAEMRQHGGEGCANAFTIGTFLLIGMAAIGLGQYLFVSSLPGYAGAALSAALGLCAIYTVFYRALIRASEVMGRFGRGLCLALAGLMVGTNAMLAGHELVILAFAPQVAEMGTLATADATQLLRDKSGNALGLGQLRTDDASLTQTIAQKRAELATVPPEVTALQSDATRCDASTRNLQARLPARDADGYAQAWANLRSERTRCKALRTQADTALANHRKPLQADLAALGQSASTNSKALASANASQAETLSKNAGTLKAANTTGFARHKALWAAVEAGKVPTWAALGLMAIALLLEGSGMLLKLLLPPDGAANARASHTQEVVLARELEHHYIRAMRQQVKPALREFAAKHAATELGQLQSQVLAPGLHTRLAANAFATAHQRTRAVQKATGQAATEVISHLADVAAGVVATGNMAFYPQTRSKPS